MSILSKPLGLDKINDSTCNVESSILSKGINDNSIINNDTISLKRKYINNTYTSIKRKKINNEYDILSLYNDNIWNSITHINNNDKWINPITHINSDDKWISGTEISNYLINDPLIDWLKCYYKYLGLNINHSSNNIILNDNTISNNIILKDNKESTFMGKILKNGNIFEEEINKYIKNKFNIDEVITIAKGRDDCTINNYIKTSKAILSGKPIILQGVLININNNTRGIADIIIRSDYIRQLITRQEVYDNDIYIKGEYLKGNYHYLIIDIKWSCINFCCDDKCIYNDGRIKAYKGQLAIYNSILGKIQGYTSRYAYILSKSYINNMKEKGWNCFDRLGTIDYMGYDNQFIKLTVDAINWIRRVHKEGHQWSPLNPLITEMCVNSTTDDYQWGTIKKEILKQTNDLINIWNITIKNRNEAFNKGVKKWSDPCCTLSILGIKKNKRGRTINKILNINRQQNMKKNIIEPKIIKNNFLNWQNTSFIDFYIDFETINDHINIDDMNIINSHTYSDIIYMIGIGWIENNNWNYKCFVMNTYNLDEEYRIINEFTNFITTKFNQLKLTYDKYPKLFHWGKAEPTIFSNVNIRHNYKWTSWEYDVFWIDMCNIFIQEPIVIRGSLSFKLKDIGNAFCNNNLIQTNWNCSGLFDGLSAMNKAIDYYDKIDNNTKTIQDDSIIETIILYNEMDCKVMWDIINYLRKNHT